MSDRSYARLPGELRDALAARHTVVTPNKRLARRLTALFDTEQQRAGLRAWPAADVVPWDAFVRTLWRDVLTSGASVPRVLDTFASARVWEAVVAREASDRLLDPLGAAGLAAEAWDLVHAYGSGGQSWRAWREDLALEDAATFARWAESYRARLRQRGAIDVALLPDAIASLHPPPSRWRVRHVMLAGFLELAPRHQRMVSALEAAGMRVTRAPSLHGDANVTRVHVETARDELEAALAWAADRIRRNPDARVAIVVHDLAGRRDEVLAQAYVELCPGALLPDARRTPPFELSLGQPLADIPLVSAALGCVELAHAPLPVGELAALLRSPYLALPDTHAGTWQHRGALEVEWLEQGRTSVSFKEALVALKRADASLYQRWRDAARAIPLPARASPRHWADVWRERLARYGWPGARSLDSGEWQARAAFDDLLTAFASLGTVEPSIGSDVAHDVLRRMARETLFQPERHGAPIQILGLLEAAGIAFDAVWIAGLTADRWPPAPAPHPMLPIAWQRERGAPHCSAPRELAYAEGVTALLAQGADEVVFSSARREGDTPLWPSPLIVAFPERAGEVAHAGHDARRIHAAALEGVDDTRAPPLGSGRETRGGASVIASYADCPFQALARARLRVEPWPARVQGLTARERGILVHAALAHFWEATRDQQSLLALRPDALQARIAECADRARGALLPERWKQVPEVVAAGEEARLARLLSAWLVLDSERPAFRVQATESHADLALGGLNLSLRLDRIDALASGGVAIIDYKTGAVERPRRWFDDERPRAPQLGLYALAQRFGDLFAPPVRSVAYAQLRADGVQVVGVAADPDAWPRLTPVDRACGDSGFADWSALESWWDAKLGDIARRHATGLAPVLPRNASACGVCLRHALCRVLPASMMLPRGDGDA